MNLRFNGTKTIVYVGFLLSAMAFSELRLGPIAFAPGQANSSPGAFSPLMPEGEAPRRGMSSGSWSSGNKEFFGTAYESYDESVAYSESSSTAPISKVWFTGAKGILTEVFWPTLDTKQVKDAQLLVSDGSNFFFEEKNDATYKVEWVVDGVPAYKITSRDSRGRFQIEKTLFTDPNRNVLIKKYKIIKNVPGLNFYFLHNPAIANTTLKDSARVVLGNRGSPGEGLFAWEGSQAQAVVFSAPLKQVSAGFEAANDGYQDLLRDLSMDSAFERALNGNVVNTAWIDLDTEIGIVTFDVVISFAADVHAAYHQGLQSLKSTSEALEQFTLEWKSYQATVKDLSAASTDGGVLYRASVALLKSMEDKTYEGAYVASPSVPWGQYRVDDGKQNLGGHADIGSERSGQIGGYHLVWPRDLFQMATTFLAIGDSDAAIASLKYFRRIQYGAHDGEWIYGSRRHNKNGSFLQNCWVNGSAYWTQLQMDQTAFPVMLTWRLWSEGHVSLVEYWDMARRAADFIQSFGPWTGQERWEENFGVAPSTVAVQISALWLAADMARAMGDHTRANLYTRTADSWNSKPDDNLEGWTFTETGSHGNGKYYVRIEAANDFDQNWDPNDNKLFYIGNNGGFHREKDVIDGGFLELVRFGLRSARDYHIQETIYEYDQVVKVNTRQGPGFYRYNGDRYNYDDANGQQTNGMLWPFLTGERGHYELAKAQDKGYRGQQIGNAAIPYIQTMENFATPSLMLPEQVWDYGVRQGQPTGAATPLGWTHGEYIKLLSSRSDNAVSDRMEPVIQRAKILKSMSWDQVKSLTELKN